MKFKSIYLSIIFILLFTFNSFSFCSNDIQIYVGETINLNTYIEEDENFPTTNDITWTSGNIQVGSIDKKGFLTGISSGKLTVIATTGRSINTKSKLINITIKTAIKEFNIIDSDLTLYPGEKHTVNYELISNSENHPIFNDTIKWTSENLTVVKIDDKGILTGIRSGKTTITGTTVDGEKTDRLLITVKNSREKLTINNNTYNVRLKVGEKSKLTATIKEKDVSSDVFWSSSSPSIARIDKYGNITGVNEGHASIKASTGNSSIYDYIDIYVSSMVKDLKFNVTSITLKEVGETYTLIPNLIPADPNIKPIIDKIQWSSTNNKIATVDNNGKITALSAGIVRISAKSLDSEREAGCTVKVDVPVKQEKEIFVQKIEFTNIPEYGVYGEKIPLTYTIYPENATNKDIKISITGGTANQIKIIDGNYYFIPSKLGDTKLTIKASSNVSDTAKIRIDSAIMKFEIKPENLNYTNKKYTMYIGQKTKLNYIFKTKSPYSEYNIFPEHFVLTSDSKNTVAIEKLDGDIILRAINTGDAIIQSHTSDNRYNDSINIYVKSPIKKPYTDRSVILPINQTYRPNYYGEISKYIDYNFDKVDLTNSYEITITKQYIKESYIDKEIEFETNLIKKLDYTSNDKELSTRKTRLNILKSIKSSAKNGYCKFLLNTNLTDRNGKIIRIAEVSDKNKITGLVDGKVDISINMIYSNFYSKSSIEFTSDNSKFEVTTDLGKKENYETILRKLGYIELVENSSLNEKIEFTLKCQNRFSGKLTEDIPNKDYIKSTLKLEEMNLLTDKTKINYKKNLNKEELSELSIKIYEYLSNKEILKEDNFRFLDTKNIDVNNAYELGFITSKNSDYFNPGLKVSKTDVLYTLKGIMKKLDENNHFYKAKIMSLELPELLKKLESNDSITIEEMIGVLGEFIR